MRRLTVVGLVLMGLTASVATAQRGVDTFEEARSVEVELEGMEEVLEGMEEGLEWESSEAYTVIPLLPFGAEGEVRTDGTLWVHFRSRWSWTFFSYSSDVWAWVTDAKKDGKLVEVDQLEAHLVHDSCYGDHSVTVKNKSKAHAYFKMVGIAVCKTGITAWACAEEEGYGRWCSDRKQR